MGGDDEAVTASSEAAAASGADHVETAEAPEALPDSSSLEAGHEKAEGDGNGGEAEEPQQPPADAHDGGSPAPEAQPDSDSLEAGHEEAEGDGNGGEAEEPQRPPADAHDDGSPTPEAPDSDSLEAGHEEAEGDGSGGEAEAPKQLTWADAHDDGSPTLPAIAGAAPRGRASLGRVRLPKVASTGSIPPRASARSDVLSHACSLYSQPVVSLHTQPPIRKVSSASHVSSVSTAAEPLEGWGARVRLVDEYSRREPPPPRVRAAPPYPYTLPALPQPRRRRLQPLPPAPSLHDREGEVYTEEQEQQQQQQQQQVEVEMEVEVEVEVEVEQQQQGGSDEAEEPRAQGTGYRAEEPRASSSLIDDSRQWRLDASYDGSVTHTHARTHPCISRLGYPHTCI